MTDVTFLATGLNPYWGHGEKPEAARSRETFEKRPGQADARQGVAPGHGGARPVAGGHPQSRHRPGPRGLGRADRFPLITLPQGSGAASSLQPPPDNSWDRRADFANAHRARASTRGFSEAPQQGYVGKTPVSPGELDPDLARALGIDEGGDDKTSAEGARGGVIDMAMKTPRPDRASRQKKAA